MLQLLHLLFDADEVSLALVIGHVILGHSSHLRIHASLRL